MPLLIIVLSLFAISPAYSDDGADGNPLILEEPGGRLVAFFPEGGVARIGGPAGHFELQSGHALECPAGDYLFEFSHPEYSVYMKRITVRPNTDCILIPRLEPSGAYLEGLARSLEGQRVQLLHKRRSLSTSALAGGILSLAGLAAAGGIEFILADRKSELDSAYRDYRNASAADAPGLWASVEGIEARIGDLRSLELAALGASSAFAGAGFALAAAAPSARQVDRQIEFLRKAASE
jgi:hypothetical protein